MPYVHLIFGIFLFAVFTITGQYMRADFPDKSAISPELRVLMMSRHIYILFSALIHIVLGTYLRPAPSRLGRSFQHAGSAILFAASILLVCAFVTESYQYHSFSNLSRIGIFASLAGVAVHMFAGAGSRK